MFKNRHEVDFGDSELSILVLQELEVNGNNYQRKVKNRKLKKKNSEGWDQGCEAENCIVTCIFIYCLICSFVSTMHK